MTNPIPPQSECDPHNPEEHFLWALQSLPTFAGIGAVTHSGFLRQWSSHLWQTGCAHRDYLVGLADENGNIHVSQLPKQQIKFQPPFRGPRHQFNNAGRWVGKDTPDPTPMRLPDIRQLTQQENDAMIRQYEDAGLVNRYAPQASTATVLN